MTGYFIPSGTDVCTWPGCQNDGSRMGLCKDHYPQTLEIYHKRIRDKGLARPKPDCFTLEDQWMAYEVWWNISDQNKRQTKADPCVDCDPETRNRMHKDGRCEHPETVFILRQRKGEEEMIGVNGNDSGWDKAVIGLSGKVISPPIREARDKNIMERLDAGKKNRLESTRDR